MVIHISLSCAPDPNIPDFESRHYASWPSLFCRNFVKSNNQFNFEVWKIYDKKEYGDLGTSSRIKDGIKFRLFPATQISRTLYISISLLQNLRKEIKSQSKLIVHLQNIHT